VTARRGLTLERDVDFELLTELARFDVLDELGELVGLITEQNVEPFGRCWWVRDVPPPRPLEPFPPAEWSPVAFFTTPQLALEALANHRAWS